MKRTILYLLFIVILSLFATACGATPTPETIIETTVSEVIETPTTEPTAAPTTEPTATLTAEPTATLENTDMEPEFDSGFADVNGTRLYYETDGDGEAVVFIHGFGGDTLSWQQHFAELAKHHKVVNYDMRGFGKSNVPTDQPYTHADDLKALLDYLEIESAHVIGHSFGGEIALNFALAYPEATQSLTLIEPDISGAEGLPAPTPEEEAAFGAIFAALEEGDHAGAALGLVDNHPIFAVSRNVPSVRKYHLEILADYQWFHFMNEDPVVQPQPPSAERLGKIVAPTLLFVGDSTTQYQTMEVDMLVEQVPNARKVVVENSDHFPHVLYPDDFNARVLDFLEEVEETATQEMEPADKVEVVELFDASRSELPEGIAIDKAGNIYVSLGPPLFVGGGFGEIWKISPDGTETTLAQFEGGPPAAGLAVDAAGTVYYAYPSDEEDTQGVYRLTADGDTERLPGTEVIILANGLAFDEQGNLYVSDSILGAIWRIPPGGSAELWLQHDLLAGCLPDDPFGANGVALWEGNLYAANTAKGILVSIPILADGSAGEAEKVAGVGDCDAEVKDLYGMDGIALDAEGNVYALLVMQNKLVKIDPVDGTFTILLTEDDGLHNPASIVFGIGKDNRESVFFTNYAVLPPEPATSPGPAVLKFDVGVPGLPSL